MGDRGHRRGEEGRHVRQFLTAFFEPGSGRPDWFTGVGSLVETYHDLLEDRNLREVSVVGSSFGGWLAAEPAVRGRIRRVVLVDAIGPAIEGHETRLPSGPQPMPVSPKQLADP